MKKLLLSIIFLCVTFNNNANAQQHNKQRIKLLKTSYITEVVKLTPKEAEKFWPIYNLYSEKIQELKMEMEKDLKQKINVIGSIDNLTETDAQKYVNKLMENEKEISDNKIKMIKELSKILAAKKIVKLQKAEIDFNKRMLQEYGKRKRLQGQGLRKNQ
jgi:hypothetical protein